MRGRARRWLEIAVRIRTADPDGGDESTRTLLADGLIAVGGRAVVEEDGWQVTHLPEPDDPEALVASLTDQLGALTGLDGIDVRTRWLDQENWAETWKRGLSPRRIGERLLVRPSWIPVEPRPHDVVVVIDPGMAFGTAEHGTTRGCLRLLDQAVAAGERVLDVGAGSGILSVAAALLGAREVVAVEGDALACEVLLENARHNGVADGIDLVAEWVDANAMAGLGSFDGVVANIETGKLLPLLPGLAAAVRPAGWLILSGALASEQRRVRRAVEALGLESMERDADGDWRSGLWRRIG